MLARNGRAAIGDLRYLADTQLGSFPTPLAKAQVAAALALYGDRVRAERVFRAAVEDAEAAGLRPLAPRTTGRPLRDDAAVLTLRVGDGDRRSRISSASSRQINTGRAAKQHTSTQEDAWSLLAAHALLTRQPPELTVDGVDLDGPFARSFGRDDLAAAPEIRNRADAPVSAEVTVRGVPEIAPPASAEGYQITRSYYTLDGATADPSVVGQGERLVAMVEVVPVDEAFARVIVNDPLPAGFEIDNPAILRAGDVAALDFLDLTGEAATTQFRAERFLAAFDKAEGDTAPRRFAYVVRAISPGEFVHPAAIVEDMYRPERRGRTNETRVSVIGPLR